MGTDRGQGQQKEGPDSAECHPLWLLCSPGSPALKPNRVRRPRFSLHGVPSCSTSQKQGFAWRPLFLLFLRPLDALRSAMVLRPCACSGLGSPPLARLSYGASHGAALTASPAPSSEPHGRMSFVSLWTLALEHGPGSPRGSFCICSLEVQGESPSAASR